MDAGGFVLVRGPCLVCNQLFSFHPTRVPSVTVCARCRRPLDQHSDQDHEIEWPTREPICEACVTLLNARRVMLGRSPIPILPGAYGPADAEEIAW